VSDTQIVVTQRASPRRLVAVAAAGLVAGIAIGFTLATLTHGPVSSVVAAPAPQASPAAQVAAAAAAPAAPKPAAAIPVAATSAVVPQDLLSRRLVAGKSLLEDPAARYSVQLMVTEARDREYLEGYLAQAARAVDPDKLFLVPAGNPETPRVGVLFGGYRERTEANAALSALPADLRLFRPYVRSLDTVREDARRAQLR
jgi:DamX protein